jgi:hypothetical protein
MELTPDETLFVQAICLQFHENGEWPTLRWLETEFLRYNPDIDVLELEYQLECKMFASASHYPRQLWDSNSTAADVKG